MGVVYRARQVSLNRVVAIKHWSPVTTVTDLTVYVYAVIKSRAFGRPIAFRNAVAPPGLGTA